MSSFTTQFLSEKDVSFFKELLLIFEKAFEMEHFKCPSESYLKMLLQNPGFRVMVATHEGKAIGGLTLYLLQEYYQEKTQAYLYDIGVHPDFQGQGTGTALLEHTRIALEAEGITELFVQSEMVDEMAIRFYRKNNPSEVIEAVQFTFHSD